MLVFLDLTGGGDGWTVLGAGALGAAGAYAAGYGSWLSDRGYSRWPAAHRLWQLDLLSRWLEREGLSPGGLTVEGVREFLAARRTAGYSSRLSVRSTALSLEYLRELCVVPPETLAMAVEDPLEPLLAAYGRYLLDASRCLIDVASKDVVVFAHDEAMVLHLHDGDRAARRAYAGRLWRGCRQNRDGHGLGPADDDGCNADARRACYDVNDARRSRADGH